MSIKLGKASVFGDIHFGARSNSQQHNQDCLDYLDWFCTNTINNKCDHIIFLGDWFENRNALNIGTLHFSYLGAKMLNDLNIPIYFIIGNHDLYHRHTREIHSTILFNEFSNFTLITEPTIIPEIVGSPLLSPYLFHDEYPDLIKYKKTKVWFGHFEFKDFIVTGSGIKMPSGPDPEQFKGPKFIFSGHFHKRQKGSNIVYIGNTFPTSFGDVGDFDRGMMIFDHNDQEPIFFNWEDCPTFIRTKLSILAAGGVELLPISRVECLLDLPVSYEEHTTLKQSLISQYKLRDFVFKEELVSISDDGDIEEGDALESTNELIIRMLTNLSVPKINNNTLIGIYGEL
jgi:DNA repair exonuclease SbcCD nuclease subunit